jgi:DNA-binding HxlR family transcriptional regulator
MVSPVTSKVLTPTLPALERDGLISRTVHPPVPPRVDYGLTELDPSLLDPLTLLRDWAENHVPSIL